MEAAPPKLGESAIAFKSDPLEHRHAGRIDNLVCSLMKVYAEVGTKYIVDQD